MMPRLPSIYTPRIMKVVQRMVEDGSTNKEIAMAIGTTATRVSSRLGQLGIKRAQLPDGVEIKLSRRLCSHYAEAAALRGITVHQLVRLLLTEVAHDNLISAILDDGK
jgi:hypothetical protein